MSNFKILQKMKKLNLNKMPQWMAFVALLFILSIGNVWGNTNNYWYAHLTVTTNPSTGAGLVYADRFKIDDEEATGTYQADSYEGEGRATSSGGNATFHAYAKANRGYKFDHWKDGEDESKTDEHITVTRTVYTGDEGKDKTSVYTEYSDLVAYFVTNSPITNGVTYKAAMGGSFKADYELLPAEEDVNVTSSDVNNVETYDSDVITLTATAASGYNFKGWKVNGNAASNQNPWETSFESYAEVEPVFESGEPNFKVDGVTFTYLNDAIEFAKQEGNSPVVVVNQNCTLPSGKYTIPSGVTLLVPNSTSNEIMEMPLDKESTWVALSKYRELTLSEGVNIIVKGAINIAARQLASTSSNPGPGSVMGAYGAINMANGGHIEVANGGKLYAYGFIIGSGNQSTSGTITIKAGGTVYENLVINDMHGGGGSAACVNGTSALNDYDLFPFNQYFIQNIEPRMTLEYGALEQACYNIYSTNNGGKHEFIDLIGNSSESLFQTFEGCSITKWYDATRDYQCYEVDGKMFMNSLTVYATSSIALASQNFILPVTSSMEINLLRGATLDLPYKVKLLPGAKLIIGEGATVNVHDELYVYDKNDWDKYACGYGQTFGTTNAGKLLAWHDHLRDVSALNKLDDAVLEINGTLNLIDNAAFYTSLHKGYIKSSSTGRIVYGVAGKTDGKNLYECFGTYGKKSDGTDLVVDEYSAVAEGQVLVGKYSFGHDYRIYGTPVATTPAQLRNADGTYFSTAEAIAGTKFTYADGQWWGWKAQYSNGGINTGNFVTKEKAVNWLSEAIDGYNPENLVVDDSNQVLLYVTTTENVQTTNEVPVVPIEENKIVETTTIEENGTITISANTTLSTAELVISADPDNSGQIIPLQESGKKEGNIEAANVYFDLTRGEGKVFKHHTWYAFSVPFKVNPADILFDGVTMQYNTENKKDAYEILYYNGAERAKNGKTANCWVKAETANENLVPGRFYMIANTKRDVTTIRFPKVAGADLLTTSVDVSDYASTTGNNADANWNGIANPALYHANMNAFGSSDSYAYTYNPDADPSNAYKKITLNTENIKLGMPFFVQAQEAKSVVVAPVSVSLASAPRRTKAQADESIRYQVMIAKENASASDDVVIRMDEEKEEDTYVLGKDLVRMGMSSINPQMWIDRYNEKLCVNVQAPVNDEAYYPLGIFAPADGEYDLFIDNQPNDNTVLYLTMDGEAIWNLSDGRYTLHLSKGNTNSYGLRIVGKKAPAVTTGVDEAIVDAKGETKKMLINNKVYIIRENHVYTVDGQLVK